MKAQDMFEQELNRVNSYIDTSTNQEEINYLKLRRTNILLEMRNNLLLEQLTKIEMLKPHIMYCCDKCKKKFEGISND
jgi:hypothetical protein